MAIKTVTVFGATGVQGQAQVRALSKKGFAVRAVNRSIPDGLWSEHTNVTPIAADYDDPASLEHSLDGSQAVFFQAPALGDNAQLLVQCANLVRAIDASDVELTVVNSSMWAPDAPCGEIIYDGVLAMEEVFAKSGLPVIIFRPTLYMDNLLGDWIKGSIVNDALYYYPHKEGMLADWIALDDVAQYMIAALDRPDLAGRRFQIGGPETLTTLQMLETIGTQLGKPIAHKFMTPREFGEFFWDFYGVTSGLDRPTYVAGWDSFYSFNNDAPQRPFQLASDDAQNEFNVERVAMAEWASKQDWSVTSP